MWKGYRDANGYGRFSDSRQLERGKTYSTTYAHRFSYELANGPIPEGLDIDHLCRHPGCVRPDHLEAVTPRTNILRGIGTGAKNARKKVCIRGHNDWVKVKNGRKCRTCFNQYFKDRWHNDPEFRAKHAECRRKRMARRAALAA